MPGRTRLVVVADDFGKSSSVNRAVAEAQEKGILTAASIMPGGEAFEEAVRIARNNQRLSIGVHITLCDGPAVLPRSSIPDLVDERGFFEKSPSLAWIRYSQPGLRTQLCREIEAQIDRVKKAGIVPTHLDGHHHMHMQPSVFSLLLRHAVRAGIRWIRLPREPLSLVLASAGRGALPLIEWIVFGLAGVSHKKKIRDQGLRTPDRVYGLAHSGHLNERNLVKILKALRPLSPFGGPSEEDAVIEIFSHPDAATTAGISEREALISPAVARRLASTGLMLSGYREL